MKPNVIWHQRGDSTSQYVEVLDDTLSAYGLLPGDVVQLHKGAVPPGEIPVWELDGELHSRHLVENPGGWVQAYTSFLSARISFSLPPIRVMRIRRLGWISRK